MSNEIQESGIKAKDFSQEAAAQLFQELFGNISLKIAGADRNDQMLEELRPPVPAPVPPFPRPEPDPWPQDPCAPDPLPWPKPGCPAPKRQDDLNTDLESEKKK